MDFKEVCCNIRSCLNSSKSQLSLGQLLRDYHDVLGEAMPYRALGYNSAEALIRAVPNLRISSIRGEIFIDVKADEKTAHIASLVREQRSAKKKKRKPSRGTFYRGSAPPPRRPATMPPPRRSAPPPRSSEYYPSQRRDSTLQTSYPSYQSQRRPSPPRRIDRDNNYTQRDNNYTQRDNDYTQRDNNYTQRDNNYTQRDNYTQKDISSFTQRDRDNYSQRDRNNYTQRRDPVASYQNHRNPTAPIEISSDEENGYDYNNRRIKNYEEDIQRKYRAHPSQYDFSDPNEDNDDYGSDFDDCDEINSKMEELKVTVGKQRQVSINKPQLRSYPSNTSNEDDFGYSSMNEINAATAESMSGEVSSKGKGDARPKMNVSRGPAALLAAGRAMKEPNSNSKNVQRQEPKLSPYPVHSFIKNYLSKNSTTHGDSASTPVPARAPTSREPFRTAPRNKTTSINDERPSIINDKRPSSKTSLISEKRPSTTSLINDKRPSPTESPENKAKPITSLIGSKMSDSNMFKPGPHVPPDLSSHTFCGKLHEFAIRHSLQPPQFKTFVKFCPKTKAASYMCKVKIGSSLSFASCPYESNLVKNVQEYTAKIAYEELQKRYENLDSTALPVTTDENVIIKRIAEIVNPHSSGLKSETIELKYKLLHQQILPLDWLDIVKNRSLLSVEELMGGIMAVYPIEEGTNAHMDVSKLPPLVLPENEVWNVYVTCCMSTSCVYFRIIHDDYNGLYAVMDEKMFELYESKRDSDELRHVEMVKEGSYYAAYLDGAWFRVKALSTIIDGIVRVCLIDHGDIDEVQKDELFPLDERFTNLPAQKVSCNLTGLEKYSKEPYVTRIVSELTCGKAFVAKVDTRNPSLQLTFLDTSTDVDVNVNELISERIEKELEPPKIPSQSNVTDAYLVSVKEDGLAFVQIYSESFKLLKSFLDEASEELAANLDKYRVQSANELLGSKIFLARYALDGKWYRVVIDRVVSDEQIEVLFVDYGNLDVVALKDIADVDHFTEALSMMPNQAVQVRLVKPSEELFTENVLQFMMDLSLPKEAPEPTRFLLKTVKEGAIPDVYLFYRLTDTNQLVNVNDIIASYFPEFRRPDHLGIKLSTVKSMSITRSVNDHIMVMQPKNIVLQSKPKETLERIYPIPAYNVPCNEQFSVYVTMVSSPFNFIVQPQADTVELAKLKSAMNEFYDKEEPFVDVSKIREDETYAVKNKDNKWYRGLVVKLMNSHNSISVKLVDYGEIITIPHSSIAHLLPCFRTLPRQAIKAELAGVTPLHSDWCVDDSLRFKQLVSEKLLISIVVDVLEDGKISIILYDTSTIPEIDVGAVLVQEGRAKDITEH